MRSRAHSTWMATKTVDENFQEVCSREETAVLNLIANGKQGGVIVHNLYDCPLLPLLRCRFMIILRVELSQCGYMQ